MSLPTNSGSSSESFWFSLRVKKCRLGNKLETVKFILSIVEREKMERNRERSIESYTERERREKRDREKVC